MCAGATSLVVCSVELGHELAVGGAGGGELAVAFFELDAQIGGLISVAVASVTGSRRLIRPALWLS
jgi:hypothetical protein